MADIVAVAAWAGASPLRPAPPPGRGAAGWRRPGRRVRCSECRASPGDGRWHSSAPRTPSRCWHPTGRGSTPFVGRGSRVPPGPGTDWALLSRMPVTLRHRCHGRVRPLSQACHRRAGSSSGTAPPPRWSPASMRTARTPAAADSRTESAISAYQRAQDYPTTPRRPRSISSL